MDLNEFKEEIRASLLHDLAVSEVRTTGATLKEALRLASGELDLPLKRIQFDVIQKGSKGVLGIGKKEWVIVAYPGGEEAEQSEGEGNVAADGLIDAETGLPVDQDGIAIVKCINENVTLCVRPPKGSGAPATYEQVVEKLAKRGVGAFDEAAVKRALKLKENKIRCRTERFGWKFQRMKWRLPSESAIRKPEDGILFTLKFTSLFCLMTSNSAFKKRLSKSWRKTPFTTNFL